MILLQGHLLGLFYLTLFSLWLTSEIFLLLKRRAASGLAARDRGFTRQALTFFILTNLGAIACLSLFRGAVFATEATAITGLILMMSGMLLRGWAIAYLLAVADAQPVVDTGPYRLIRHPSYTGLLMICLGIGLCFGNAASLVVIFVPILALAMQRMRVEEEALASALGDDYRAYASHTKRLIPGIY